jgi:uncharacterized membrane protein (DUF4010 family)
MVQPALLPRLAWPLLLAGAAAVLYGLASLRAGQRPPRDGTANPGTRAFNLVHALAFAAIVALVLLLSAALNDWLGARGTLLAAALAGLVDTHAAAASAATQVAAGKLPAESAVLAIALGVSTNTLVKAAVAYAAGGAAYAARIVPGLVAMLVALWLGVWLA